MPLSPFFKGGIFSEDSNPSLEKRGKGRFLGGMGRELCSEFLRQDTRLLSFARCVLRLPCSRIRSGSLLVAEIHDDAGIDTGRLV